MEGGDIHMVQPEQPTPTGPFLAAAVICERVLQEKDGVLSVIRLIDQLTHTIVAPSMPEELPKVTYNLTFLLAFKSGRARGRQNVSLMIEDPSGIRNRVFGQSIQLEGENRGANLIVQSNITFGLEGIYWFDVLLDEKLVTRMPFKMMYQLVSASAGQV
jgi:hypothetical protein